MVRAVELAVELAVAPVECLRGPDQTVLNMVGGVGQRRTSALGWYRPSVGVPETLYGRPSGVLV